MFTIPGKSATWLLPHLVGIAASIAGPRKLALPDTGTFTIDGHPAVIFLPPVAKRATLHPWIFDALYRELTEKRGFAKKPCLFGRICGGLWVAFHHWMTELAQVSPPPKTTSRT